MPNTVRMKKGTLYADIYNSEETIARAMSEGYVLVDEESIDNKIENAIVDAIESSTENVDEEKESKLTKGRRGRR